MRILVFTPYFPPHLGGLETLLGEYVGALVARGHDVDVLTSSEPGDLPAEAMWRGAAVHRLPLHSPLYRQDVGRIAQVRTRVAALKRDRSPHVVHVHVADGSVIFHALTAHVHPVPVVVSVHSALAAAEARPGTPIRRVLTSADWVTACSRSMLQQTTRVVSEIADRSSVVLNALDPARIRPTDLPTGAPVILLIGRLTREKGFDVALEAAARVRRAVPDATVLLAGDGPERAPLAQLADALGLGGAIEVAGPVAPEDVPALLERATVVVVPSRYEEPFGLVAVEAALAGRPVVASRAGGLPEVVADGTTGLLVPPEDPDAIAAAVIRLVRDREEAARLGRTARTRAEIRFVLDRHVEEYEALFDRVRAGRDRDRHRSRRAGQ